MGRAKILLVCSNGGRMEALALLCRRMLALPIVLHDLAELPAAGEDAALMVLHGPESFCEPFFQAISTLRSQQAVPPLLVLATISSEHFAIASLRAGAAEYLTEPLDNTKIAESIARFVPPCPSVKEEPELTGGEVLVGRSAVMQALRIHIRRVAATDCNVLITGETGTGKELVAQLIHQNSARRAHPIVCFNCAAIPDALLESELFGYERGAFTGAGYANQGKLMAANRGSVFFDEIGDMSASAQAKVLRAIETKEVQRLGATRRYETDIRILAATHHNLDNLSSADSFRRDLYFRLNVGRIYLPPLRERKSDIAGLVECMVTEFNKKLGRRIEGATSAAIRSLAQHDWPGNVRELKNVIERVFILRDSGRISEEDVAFILPRRRPGAAVAGEEELQSLQDTLATCNGNKSKAAEALNCSRMTLYRKLAKYEASSNSLLKIP